MGRLVAIGLLAVIHVRWLWHLFPTGSAGASGGASTRCLLSPNDSSSAIVYRSCCAALVTSVLVLVLCSSGVVHPVMLSS